MGDHYVTGAKFECSPLDEIIPPLYFAYVLTFETTDQISTETLFRILESGYQRLLKSHPVLAANIVRDDSDTERCGHINLTVPEHSSAVGLVKTDLRQPESGWRDSYSYLKARGMPSDRLDAKILAPLAAGLGTDHRVFSAQFNAIPGGVLLAVCFSHTFADAGTASTIIGLWAEQCRGLQEGSPVTGVTANFENLINAQIRHQDTPDYSKLKDKTDLWKLLGLDWKRTVQPGHGAAVPELPLAIPAATTFPGQAPTSSQIFSVSIDALGGLKRSASVSSDSAHHWISTNDALIAFLWRHIMRARFPAVADTTMAVEQHCEPVESTVTVAINGRKTLSLPESYLGNVIFCNMCTLPLHAVTAPEADMSYLAQHIRHTVQKNKTKQNLSNALELASCIPSEILRRLRYAFSDFNGPDLVTTSWIDLPLYDMDWGNLGGDANTATQIEYFRMPAEQFNGICCILPRKRDGTVEVVVGMKPEAMTRLLQDETFSRFAKISAR